MEPDTEVPVGIMMHPGIKITKTTTITRVTRALPAMECNAKSLRFGSALIVSEAPLEGYYQDLLMVQTSMNILLQANRGMACK